jgi:uncharacterized membrane protein
MAESRWQYSASRLDLPRGPRRLTPRMDPDAFARLSERVARFLGTGRFLAAQSVIVLVWIVLNLTAASLRWDPYPFILLNLAFSTQAAYAAPLILLAQNRQDDRDRMALKEDRARAERTKADTEYLARELAALRLAVGEVVTRDFLRSELARLTELREPGSPESAASDRSRPDRSGADRSGADRSGADRSGADRSGGYRRGKRG